MKKWLIFSLLLSGMQAYPLWAQHPDSPRQQAAHDKEQMHGDTRILRTRHPTQPFDMAAKLQWNPHDQRWDKVLVLYNGAAMPDPVHPVWNYLKGLQDPHRPPQKKGENIGYQAFRLKAHCTGQTPLSSGKPLYISFNQNQLGTYREEDYFRDWNCPDWEMGLQNTRIVNGAQSRDGQQSLRLNFAKYRAGCENGLGCFNWKPKLGADLESIYYSYWVKFPENFDFVLGGKLPGVGSAEGGTGGGKPNGRDGWSVRAMWEGHGKLGQYVYHMDQPKHFGDFMPWETPEIERGQWYQVKTFVRLNTPGKRDGIIRTWLNNQQVLYRQDLAFRSVPDVKIERFLFSAFYGGSGPQWAPSQDMVLYLDDFVISGREL
ncbi:MAG: hypothetical protein R3E95_15900 [Thiolinea sp.]